MFEYVNTSVPNGLLPGTHGFCGVAMTRDLPEPVRRRLESFSSYTHLETANGPDYLRLNPVSWSHFVLDGGEHVLGCVRAAPFDYTGRTNRLARFWFFQPSEFPNGLNPADSILQGGNAESLSDAWSGEPRWLAPRAASPISSVTPRSDVRPAAWMQTFGDADGPRLAAAFSVLLAERIRAKGRPLVFLANPATHGDGSLLLSLFADLIALLPAPLRAKATFSTYPVALSTSTACHLRGEFGDGTRLLAGETAWVDLRARHLRGAENAVVSPELLFLATHGHEQPPEPVIGRGSAQSHAPLAQQTSPAPSRTPRLARGPKPPVGRLISRTAAPRKKQRGFEDYLLWALMGALVIGVILFILVFFGPSSPAPAPDEPTPVKTVPKKDTTKKDKPPEVQKPKEEKPSDPEQTSSTNAPTTSVESKPESKPQTSQPKPETKNPLLSANIIKITVLKEKDFDYRKVRKQEDWLWGWYESGSHSISFGQVKATSKGFINAPKNSIVIVLLDTKKGELFWKWKYPPQTRHFANVDTIDLRKLCFGQDPILFEAWKSQYGESYSIIQSDWNLLDSVEVPGPALRLDWLVEKCKKEIKNQIDDLSKSLESSRKQSDAANEQLKTISKEIENLEDEYNRTAAKKTVLQNEIADLKHKAQLAASQGKPKDAESLKTAQKGKEQELKSLPDLIFISNQLNTKRQHKEQAESVVSIVKQKNQRFEELESWSKDDAKIRAKLRATSFSISVVGGSGT